jgi:hypothetical protein
MRIENPTVWASQRQFELEADHLTREATAWPESDNRIGRRRYGSRSGGAKAATAVTGDIGDEAEEQSERVDDRGPRIPTSPRSGPQSTCRFSFPLF